MYKYLKLSFLLIVRNFKWLIILLTKKDGIITSTSKGKIYLPLKNVKFDLKESNLEKQLALDNIREELATKEIEKILNKGDNILEIGANIGYFVILESSIIGKNGQIFALEPEEENYKILKKNILLNNLQNQVKTYKLAISDKAKEEKLYTSSSCNLHSLEGQKDNEQDNYQKIQTTTIDDFIKDKKIDYIRMDIEGYEYKAIAGMKETLEKKEPIKMFIEIHPHIMGKKKTIEMLTKLKEYGLKTRTVIAHDTYIRNVLNQAYSKKMSIDRLISIIKSEKLHAYEVFFERK